LVTVGARDCAGVVLVDGTVTVAGGGGLSFGVTHRVGAALVALDTALVLPLLLPPPLEAAGFVTAGFVKAVTAGFVTAVTAGFVTANAAVPPAAAPLARTAVAPHLSFDLTSRGRSRLDSPPAVKGFVKGSSSSSLTPSI
jgi:fructose-specific phosphotransferase system IIC component